MLGFTRYQYEIDHPNQAYTFFACFYVILASVYSRYVALLLGDSVGIGISSIFSSSNQSYYQGTQSTVISQAFSLVSHQRSVCYSLSRHELHQGLRLSSPLCSYFGCSSD